MKKMNPISNEQISDLVDGHLAGVAGAQAFEALLADRQAVQTWYTYEVIGDVMRSAELAPTGSDLAFWERLQSKLADEPVRPSTVVAEGPASIDTRLASANASAYRWKMVAGLAGFACVGVVGLSLWAQTDQRRDAQMATQNTPSPTAPGTLVAAETIAGPMLRDARLDELMAAHRQLGGHSALQVPAGFVRSATYEGQAR